MMDDRIEGSGASQLVQLIRTLGHNTDVTVEWATVISPPPDISIQIDHMPIVLEKDDLIVVESLTKHSKKAKITGASGKMSISGGSISGETSMTSHKHSIASLTISNADIAIEEAEIEYDHELKENDRVIVIGMNHGQTYLIFERLVME